MKASMRAKLVNCHVGQRKMLIDVINLGDKRSTAKNKAVELPLSLEVSGIAIKKMAEISTLINEKNEVIMKLSLDNDLSTVCDITDSKINGINIDFTEIDELQKQQDNQAKKQKKAREFRINKLIQVTFALFVGLLILMFLSTLH